MRQQIWSIFHEYVRSSVDLYVLRAYEINFAIVNLGYFTNIVRLCDHNVPAVDQRVQYSCSECEITCRLGNHYWVLWVR